MPRTLRLAAIQMRSGTTPDENLDSIARMVDEAAARGASYVQTPEMSVAFAQNRQGLAKVAGPFEGNQAVARLATIARESGVTLHVGSMAVALADGRFANRSLLFSAAGALIAQYDKIHLFDASLEGHDPYRESQTYRGGDRAMLVEAAGMMLGLSICYDVRFGALYRALAEGGAQVLAVPAAFTVPTGEAHWEILLKARAIETGCFVVAAAQGGRHENGRATWGHSMIVDPWGRRIAAFEHDDPGVLVADIDLDAVARARQSVPALANGRPFSLFVNDTGPK